MASKPQKTEARPADKALRVVAKRAGFRRAGYSFGPEPLQIPLADISEEQEAQLRGDPMLLVVDVDIAPVAGGAEAGK